MGGVKYDQKRLTKSAKNLGNLPYKCYICHQLKYAREKPFLQILHQRTFGCNGSRQVWGRNYESERNPITEAYLPNVFFRVKPAGAFPIP